MSIFLLLHRVAPPLPLAAPVDGYMCKQSRRGNWQQRWFTFRSPSMVYWKHRPLPAQAQEPPDAVIDLRRVRRLAVDGLQMALTFSTRTYNIKCATPAPTRTNKTKQHALCTNETSRIELRIPTQH
jgi:hypothetical protein